MSSTMQPTDDPTGALQDAQEAPWSFPPQEDSPTSTAANDPNNQQPDAVLAAPAHRTSIFTNTNSDVHTLPLAIANPQVKELAARPSTPPATPPKKSAEAKKRKAPDPDGDYRSSATKKKKTTSAAPTPVKSKSKRKTSNFDDEADYKPSTKVAKKYTVDDEIEDDPDICHDDCKETQHQDMIHCDGEACRLGGKWYHTQCVGFGEDLPSNMDEFDWYCPTCRDELGMGDETNGLAHGGDNGQGDENTLAMEKRRLRSGTTL